VPEGPEIHRVADRLAQVLEGRTLVHAEYRLDALARRGKSLAGKAVCRVYARGKALLIDFAGQLTHYSHNQLYGRWVITAGHGAQDGPRAVRVILATATHTATLYSATDVALLPTSAVARHPYLAKLGPDALDPHTSVAAVRVRFVDPRFARHRLGSLLLDQAFVAGLGNYLRSDILFASRLTADLRPCDLTVTQRTALAGNVLALARRSYRSGGSTHAHRHDERAKDGGASRANDRFLVYGRAGEPCWTCGTPIVRREYGGRGIFECPACQRP